MKLFCFPYAGGSATVFHKWNKYLGDTANLFLIELAGRGTMTGGLLYNNFEQMIEEVLERIQPQLLNDRYAFYGHSMGARLSFELAHRIRESGIKEPEYLFLSGCGAPNFKRDKIPYHQLSEENFKRELAELGGIPAEVLSNPELFNYYAPIIRSDLKNLETFAARSTYVPLDMAFILMHGDRDKIPLSAVESWRDYTHGSCQLNVFSGGHFFINDYTERLTGLIKSVLSGNQKTFT